MRMLDRVAMTTALLVPLIAIAEPAAAQNYRWDLGVNGGYSWYSSMLDDGNLFDNNLWLHPEQLDDLDLIGLERDADLNYSSGWLVGAQLGYWFRHNIGVRLNGTYADRPLNGRLDIAGDLLDDLDDRFISINEDRDLIDNVNLWSGSLDLMWRFRRPNVDWTGTEVLPYVALGLGAKWINPAGDIGECADRGDFERCHPFFFDFIDDDLRSALFAMEKQTKFMGLIGLGTDIRLAPSFAIRLEVNDRIYSPDVKVIDFDEFDDEFFVVRDIGKTVHEIGVQAGLHMLMGLERPQVVTVIPAPAPPPPPPPPPAENAISVCVVDTDERWGLRMQSAYYRPATRDTVVVVNGNRVPLANVVDDVRTARNADWFVRGQPLVLTVGNERFELLTYQGARTIAANQLAYLGTINGHPVFADRDEVATIIGDLQNLHRSRSNHDIGAILEARKDLRDDFNNIAFFYVPMDKTGCVFQPLHQAEPAAKK